MHKEGYIMAYTWVKHSTSCHHDRENSHVRHKPFTHFIFSSIQFPCSVTWCILYDTDTQWSHLKTFKVILTLLLRPARWRKFDQQYMWYWSSPKWSWPLNAQSLARVQGNARLLPQPEVQRPQVEWNLVWVSAAWWRDGHSAAESLCLHLDSLCSQRGSRPLTSRIKKCTGFKSVWQMFECYFCGF